MTLIKHLILSGGGPLIFQTIGIMQYLESQNIYLRENIKSIYGTSSGAIVGLFICLGYNWDVINKFMIERPWEHVYYIDSERIYNGFKQCGVFNNDIFIKSYKSLFEAKDLSIDITLQDFYKITDIDLHMISYEINNLKMEDISHETYPNLRVIDAIHMTACLPMIFTPVFIQEKCFIDGGIVLNYPLKLCIEKYKNKNEMLGIKHIYLNDLLDKNITKTTRIFEYIINVFYKLIQNLTLEDNTIYNEIKHEIICYEKHMTFNLIISCITNSEKRKEILDNGIQKAMEYCKTLEINDDENNGEIDES